MPENKFAGRYIYNKDLEAMIDKAVKAERRELLRLITEVIILPPVPKKMLIEAIIIRGK